jgi:fluoroacetyl-CoA thioesterase
MKNPFDIGDQKAFKRRVTEEHVAAFDDGVVHPFYSTFWLGRDAEWAGRLFVLEMKEEGEEGIGTFLEVKHKSPALLGEEVEIIATLEEVKGRQIISSFEAHVGERLIAKGRTGQMILTLEKLEQIKSDLNG